jgi:hypothetical protein
MKTNVDTLRRQIAELEARLDGLREKLRKAEAKMEKPEAGERRADGQKTGLELLWEAALPKARERSSRHRCRVEWNRIPISERPTVRTLLDALKAWNRCEAWRCDRHMFVPGLHRFLKERMWEDLPEDSRPFVARPKAPEPVPVRTAEDEAALKEFLKLPARRVSS